MQYDRRVAKIATYIPLVADGARGRPLSLQVALTDKCFNRCIGCGHPSRVPHMIPWPTWLGVLRELTSGPAPVESVCYSGGDPMAYADFNRVMAWHAEHGVAFGMTITGYVPPFIDLGLMSRAEWVRVSLDAVTPEVYEKVRGFTKVEKVLASIDRMLEAGVKVGLGITLHPDNEEELPNVMAYAASKGITDIDARYAYPQSNPRWPDVDLATRGVQPFRRCRAALYQLYIDSDGAVYPCCVTAGDTRAAAQGASLGNIHTEAWPNIWEAAVNFSRLQREQLPGICRLSCVQRLSEINHVFDNAPAPSGRVFF